jgi:hypothetical protein
MRARNSKGRRFGVAGMKRVVRSFAADRDGGSPAGVAVPIAVITFVVYAVLEIGHRGHGLAMIGVAVRDALGALGAVVDMLSSVVRQVVG